MIFIHTVKKILICFHLELKIKLFTDQEDKY